MVALKLGYFAPLFRFLLRVWGASLGISRTFCPLVECFVFRGNSLSVVLADLFPLLRQSIDSFEELMGERRVMSEV